VLGESGGEAGLGGEGVGGLSGRPRTGTAALWLVLGPRSTGATTLVNLWPYQNELVLDLVHQARLGQGPQSEGENRM
jgi:hypothetical protein